MESSEALADPLCRSFPDPICEVDVLVDYKRTINSGTCVNTPRVCKPSAVAVEFRRTSMLTALVKGPQCIQTYNDNMPGVFCDFHHYFQADCVNPGACEVLGESTKEPYVAI